MSRKSIAGVFVVLLTVSLVLTRARVLRNPKPATQVRLVFTQPVASQTQTQTNATQNDAKAASAVANAGVPPNPTPSTAPTTSPASTVAPESTQRAAASGWKTYSSSEYGFEIQYPARWLYKDDYEQNYGKPPSGKRPSAYAGETRNLFDLEMDGANQPDEGGGDFEDGAVVTIKITGTSGVVESFTLTPTRPWYLITTTPAEWLKTESSLFGGNHVEHIAMTTNGFTGLVEVAHDDTNPEKIWGEAGGAYRTFPDGRVLLVSWERMNIANDLSYQNYFLPMLSSFKLHR
jgi:hypothetical protein